MIDMVRKSVQFEPFFCIYVVCGVSYPLYLAEFMSEMALDLVVKFGIMIICGVHRDGWLATSTSAQMF
jgi:hypothetical protein